MSCHHTHTVLHKYKYLFLVLQQIEKYLNNTRLYLVAIFMGLFNADRSSYKHLFRFLYH